MRVFMAGLLMLSIVPGAAAQSAPDAERPPWEWTIEERIADRLDPVKIRERAAADPRARLHPLEKGVDDDLVTSVAKGKQFEYSIDGRRNPELFLPTELFDGLLSGLAADDVGRANQRRFYRKAIRSLGYDEEMFWASLASVSGNYRGMQGTACFDRACADRQCAARYDALEAARALFGRQEFDRALYLIVAPHMQSSTAILDRNYRENLRRKEMGCR